MDLIADGSLFLAAVVASTYCLILSRRLRRLTQMDGGLGKAITNLSAEVDEMSAALETVKRSTEAAANDLDPRLAAARREIGELKEATAEAQRVQVEMTAAVASAPKAKRAPAARRTRKPRAAAAKPAGEAASHATKARTTKKAASMAPASASPAECPDIAPAARHAPSVSEAGEGDEFERALGAALSDKSDDDQEALAKRLIAALTSPQALSAGSW